MIIWNILTCVYIYIMLRNDWDEFIENIISTIYALNSRLKIYEVQIYRIERKIDKSLISWKILKIAACHSQELIEEVNINY